MKRELKILLLTSSLFMFAGGLFGPLYAVFVEGIGGNLLTAGSAYSVFAVAAGVSIFFISKWEDHVKHQEKLVVLGYAFSFIGYICYLFVNQPLDLFFVQLIFGVGGAICTPAYDGLYSKSLDKGKYASEWGMWESMAYIVTGIAALIGGYVANTYGFRILFSMMIIVSLIGLITSIILLFEIKKRNKLQ